MNDRAFRMAGRNQVFVEYRTLSRFIAISFANFYFALHTERARCPLSITVRGYRLAH